MLKSLLTVLLCSTPAFAQADAPKAIPAPAVPATPVPAEPAKSAALTVGDKAPPLSIERWLRGDEIKSFEKGKIYVVELWATWCGPCIAAMPHLSELQRKYAKDNVRFLGVNVLDEPKAVDKFMTKGNGGDKMEYAVAEDKIRETKGPEKRGGMVIDWLDASKEVGIPQTYVVSRDGVVVWMGHPTDLEPVLTKVIDGTWDLAAASARSKRAAANSERANRLEAEIFRARDAKDCERVDVLLAELQEITDRTPEDLSYYRFTTQMKCGDTTRAYQAAQLAMKSKHAKFADRMNEIAWMIVDPGSKVNERNYDLALEAARMAFDLSKGKDFGVLDTLALCEFKKGNTARAIELQTKAVELSSQDLKAELSARLTEYKAAQK